jgi:hypothetical protein
MVAVEASMAYMNKNAPSVNIQITTTILFFVIIVARKIYLGECELMHPVGGPIPSLEANIGWISVIT